MASGLPTVRIGRIRWRTPALELVRVLGSGRCNVILGEPEEDEAGKQDVAVLYPRLGSA